MLAGVAVAVAAGGGAYLLVSRGGSGPTAKATSTPTPASTPSPSAGTPSSTGSGEPPIEAADCSGGSPPDPYMAAAISDICEVVTPLAALDTACSGTPGSGCESAAQQLNQAAEAALQDIRTRVPATAGENAAAPHLRSAFQDYAAAGTEIAEGIAQDSNSIETTGMAEVSAGTTALSTAGVDLGT